jgi:hypothetical protein
MLLAETSVANEVEAAAGLLKQAARTASVPGVQVFKAIRTLENAKLKVWVDLQREPAFTRVWYQRFALARYTSPKFKRLCHHTLCLHRSWPGLHFPTVPQPDGWNTFIGGEAPPGRRWRLVFTSCTYEHLLMTTLIYLQCQHSLCLNCRPSSLRRYL